MKVHFTKGQKFLFHGFIIIIIISIFFSIFDIDLEKKYRNKFHSIGYSDININGKVVKKYIDKKNHLNKTVQIESQNDNVEFIFNRDISGAYEFINLNDSIIIFSKDYTVRLIRNDIDTTFLVDYNY